MLLLFFKLVFLLDELLIPGFFLIKKFSVKERSLLFSSKLFFHSFFEVDVFSKKKQNLAFSLGFPGFGKNLVRISQGIGQ
jgi:hypothetical protein